MLRPHLNVRNQDFFIDYPRSDARIVAVTVSETDPIRTAYVHVTRIQNQ